jgi:ADP-ribose pyrophosphatase
MAENRQTVVARIGASGNAKTNRYRDKKWRGIQRQIASVILSFALSRINHSAPRFDPAGGVGPRENAADCRSLVPIVNHMKTPQETLLETKRFCVVRTSETGRDGKPHSREIIRHPGAVTVIPLLDDGRVCLVENYRVAVGETLIELPAGTLEPGEDPRECAARELQEETGYRAQRVELLHAFYLSPGILDERMHLFLATGLTPGDPAREAGEQIKNLIVPWDEALNLVHTRRIQDAKTIVGLLYYDRFVVADGAGSKSQTTNPQSQTNPNA